MQVAVSQTVYGLPRSHWHCGLAGFRWPDDAARSKVQQFMEQTALGRLPRLLLTGTPGAGKTHLGVALYRWGVRQWGTRDCMWLYYPDFVRAVHASWRRKENEHVLFEPVRDARRLVVLDDLFTGKRKEDMPDWEYRILAELICTPYNSGAAMVVTSNYTPDGWGQYLEDHELRRLFDTGIGVRFANT